MAGVERDEPAAGSVFDQNADEGRLREGTGRQNAPNATFERTTRRRSGKQGRNKEAYDRRPSGHSPVTFPWSQTRPNSKTTIQVPIAGTLIIAQIPTCAAIS